MICHLKEDQRSTLKKISMDIQFPCFKAFIQAEVISEKRVILFIENQSLHLLEGESYALLAPYLSKGTYSTDQMIQRLEKKISITEIYYALLRLQEKGFLEESSSKLPKHIQALCHLLNVLPKDAEDRIQKTSITVKSFGDVSTKPLISILKSLSLQVKDQGNLSIVVTDNYRHPQIRELYLQSKAPYLLIQPTSSKTWIGPLFIPEKTSCLDCLLNILNNTAYETLEQEIQAKIPITINQTNTRTTTALTHNITANEIFKWIVQGSNPNIESTILSYQFLNSSIISHRILKNTHCPTCKNHSSTKPLSSDHNERMIPSPAKNNEHEHLISPTSKVSENPIQSILNLDLQYIVSRMVGKKGWSPQDAQDIVRKYKNFLTLAILYPESHCAPTPEIDEVWHDHILHTQKYAQDCEQIFGKYFHHHPSTGSKENQESLATAYQETKDLYEKTFRESYGYSLF